MDENNNLPADVSTPMSEQGTPECLSHSVGTTKDVVARYTHCALCGANLHFTHVTDFSRNLTQETAKCPECGVKVRQVIHKLQ